MSAAIPVGVLGVGLGALLWANASKKAEPTKMRTALMPLASSIATCAPRAMPCTSSRAACACALLASPEKLMRCPVSGAKAKPDLPLLAAR